MKTKFEPGDKVKFLNQVGGGVVTKVTDDFIFVQDDSGFDIPMQPEELIRMADQKGAGKLFNAAMEEHLKGKGTPSSTNQQINSPSPPRRKSSSCEARSPTSRTRLPSSRSSSAMSSSRTAAR